MSVSLSPPENEFVELIQRADAITDGNLVERRWNEYMVVADTHGYLDVSRFVIERSLDENLPLIFLGDYVDRGAQQIENLVYLLRHKLERPEDIILLRGNHETVRINHKYGFHRELVSKYSESAYENISKFYNSLPVAAVIDESDLLVHGGPAEGLKYVWNIHELVQSDPAYQELLWNDPTGSDPGYTPNLYRGVCKCYGSDAVRRFLERNALRRIIRGHQCFKKGYKWFFDSKLLSIFSIPGYCGNEGKYALVSGADIDLLDIL